MAEQKKSYSLTKSTRWKGYAYNRTGHELDVELSKQLGDCYSSLELKLTDNNVVLATSGVNAIAMAIKSVMFKHGFGNINIIYSNELYCDTPRYIKSFNELYGVSNSYPFDVTKPKELEKLFNTKCKGQVNILFFESCSNPNGNIFDMSQISQLRKLSKTLYVIVDNTWLTHIVFNPFKFDVNMVVASMSKHYSEGQCIAGFVIYRNKDLAYQMRQVNKMEGLHIPLPYCELILSSLPNMEECIAKEYNTTLEIAKFLEKQPKVVKVNFPMLKSHPSNKLANDYFRFGPTILTFGIKMRKHDAKRWMQSFKTLPFKTSFGSEEAKLDPWPTEHGGLTFCRLAIGYMTDIEKLITEFSIPLSKLK